jgi:peptidoglycan/xylan/chitin deacetylase (PgdA/CDA1 family)
MLTLSDQLGLRCTLSCSGWPPALSELVQRIVERGHERACHGDGHVLVFGQRCCEFEADARPACAAIDEFTGKPPVGYRAPTFGA